MNCGMTCTINYRRFVAVGLICSSLIWPATSIGAAAADEPEVVESILIAEAFRPWMISVHYAYADLILPGKYGFKVSRRDTATSQWEAEYTHGSFTPLFINDIGKFTEDRVSLIRRFGAGGLAGFQWFYGAFYRFPA